MTAPCKLKSPPAFAVTRAIPNPNPVEASEENACMEIKTVNGVLTVGGFAELTAANYEQFRKEVCTALNGHTAIEIDLSRTTFVDCSGLGALIALRNFARGRSGVMRLMNPTPTLKLLFDAVHAGCMFEIVNTQPTNQSSFASLSTEPAHS